MIELSQHLHTAISAAREAGASLARVWEGAHADAATLRIDTKSSPRDFVTQVDRELQALIITRLSQATPDYRFIAEEEGADRLGKPESPFTWIIDPLDGTTNFIHHKPACGTIIALMEGSSIVLGVMFLPLKGDLFHGAKGMGAFWNDAPVALRQTKNLDDAVLCTNISGRAKTTPAGEHLVPILPCASIHNYGCAADELGEILRGGNDGVFYEGAGVWDVAAGCLLIEEAGGKARWELRDATNPRKGVNCVAATSKIFTEVESFIFP